MERDIDPVRRAAPADARSRAGDRPVQSSNEETMHISALTRKNRDDPPRIEAGRGGGSQRPSPPSQLSANIARTVAAFFRRATAACLIKKKKKKKRKVGREREYGRGRRRKKGTGEERQRETER